ncbi:redoxin domain-containing protein [bacterium]|nr:redoxin domain-containing protein [bacterium]
MALDMGQSAPSFSLKDQFGKLWDLSKLNGTVTVVVAANKDSGREMGPWIENLDSKYGSKIQLLGLMDLHSIPGIGRGIAKSRIRKETPQPLMLDFDGTVSKAYSVTSDSPVVVVIDGNSRVKAIQRDEYSKSALTSIATAIDTALKSKAS